MAAAHAFLGFALDAVDGPAQALLAIIGGEGAFHRADRLAHVGAHGLELGIAQHRAVEHQHLALRRVFVEDVAEIAQARLECHHPRLAQAVDRRVRDLRECLAEEVVQPAILGREHRDRSVVAHGADRLGAILDHRVQDGLQLLEREAHGELAAAQLFGREIRTLIGVALDDGVDARGAVHPLAERLARGEQVLQRGVAEKLAAVEIDAHALTRPHAALRRDAILGNLHHAGFGAHDEQPVLGDGVAQRTQAVAVEPRDHPAAIGGADRGRPVPGLHHCVAIQE